MSDDAGDRGDEVRGEELIRRAEEIAVRVHGGQSDAAGEPYIGHPRRVAARLPAGAYELRAAALLHDVVEDSGTSFADLRAHGIPGEVVEIVDALTKRDGETYEQAVRRAAGHPGGHLVKRADVADNSDPERLSRLPPQEAERLGAKYRLARRVLDETDPHGREEPS